MPTLKYRDPADGLWKTVLGSMVSALHVQKAGDIMTGDLILNADPSASLGAATKQYVDSVVTGRNRIQNGDFAVNQRVFTSTTSSGTTGPDRWMCNFSAGTVTWSLQANAQNPIADPLPESPKNFMRLVVTGQSATSHFCQFRQFIEGVRTLNGKKVTISFWAKAATGTPKVALTFERYFGSGGGPPSLDTLAVGAVTIGTTWQRYSYTTTVPSLVGKTIVNDASDMNSFALKFYVSAGSDNTVASGIGVQNNTFDFWGIQMEEGPVATMFEQKNYATNLLECQRYYYRTPPSGQAAWGGAAATATQAYFQVQLPVPMRIKPAFSFSGAFYVSDRITTPTATGIVVVAATSTPYIMDINASVASGLTIGRTLVLQGTTSAAYLAFDADLY